MRADRTLETALRQARDLKENMTRARDRNICLAWNGDSTMKEIATRFGVSPKTVSDVLRKSGLTKGPQA